MTQNQKQQLEAKANERLTQGAILLLRVVPFYSMIIMGMKKEFDYNEKTAATDGTTVFYNPYFVLSLTVAEVAFLIAHEALHIIFLHHTRRGDRDADLWNQAADYIINYILTYTSNMLKMPKGGLFDKRFTNKLTTEQVFNILNQKKNQPQNQNGQGQPQNQNGQGQGQDAQQQNSQNNQSQSQPSQQQNQGQPTQGQNKPGQSQQTTQGQQGKPQGNQSQSQNQGQETGQNWDFGGVREATGTPQEIKKKEEETKVKITQALNAAKKMGNLDAEIETIVRHTIKAEINWVSELQEFMQPDREDYSYSRPNRRYLSTGFSLPSLYNEQLGAIAMIGDCSGSMDAETFQTIANESSDILNLSSEEELHMALVNTKVVKTFTYTRGDSIQIPAEGDGGTDFRPGFEWANQINAQMVIYFTDGECELFPEQTPDYPVLWVIKGKECAWKPFVPPFGQVLDLD